SKKAVPVIRPHVGPDEERVLVARQDRQRARARKFVNHRPRIPAVVGCPEIAILIGERIQRLSIRRRHLEGIDVLARLKDFLNADAYPTGAVVRGFPDVAEAGIDGVWIAWMKRHRNVPGPTLGRSGIDAPAIP